MKKDKTMVQEIKEVIGKELRGFRQEFNTFKQEMSNQFNDFRQEFSAFKQEMSNQFNTFKQEMGGQFNDFKQEMGGQFNDFRQEVDQKIDSGIDEAKRHAGVLAEGLRSDVKIIAEQYGSFTDRFDRVDAKLEEHDIRFDKIDLELKGMKTALFDNSHRLNDHDVRIRKLEMR